MAATRSTKDQAVSAPRKCFFDLPFELRAPIYGFVFEDVSLRIQDGSSHVKAKPVFDRSSRQLLSASRQIRQEAAPLFYSDLSITTPWCLLHGTADFLKISDRRRRRNAFISARKIILSGERPDYYLRNPSLAACSNLREMHYPVDVQVTHLVPSLSFELRLARILVSKLEIVWHMEGSIHSLERDLGLKDRIRDWQWQKVTDITDARSSICRRMKIWYRVNFKP